jgi:hypothetical protein
MGYVKNDRRPWLVLDLETTAIAEVGEFVAVAAEDAPKNYTKPDTIAAWVAAERAARISRAALDMDLARIACVGVWQSADAAPTAFAGVDDEWANVSTAWACIEACLGEGGQVVTYNGLGYDLPLLMRRAQYLNVPHRALELNKFRPGPLLDLQNVLSFSGLKPFRSLAFYSRRFNIDIPDPTTGADMPALIAAGDWEAVRAHNLADLRRTQALAQRLGYIGPPAVPEVVL